MRPCQAILHPAHRSGRCLDSDAREDRGLLWAGSSSWPLSRCVPGALAGYRPALTLMCTKSPHLGLLAQPIFWRRTPSLREPEQHAHTLQRWMAGWGCSFRCVWPLCLTIRPYCADTQQSHSSLGAGGGGCEAKQALDRTGQQEGPVGPLPHPQGSRRGLRDLCPTHIPGAPSWDLLPFLPSS